MSSELKIRHLPRELQIKAYCVRYGTDNWLHLENAFKSRIHLINFKFYTTGHQHIDNYLINALPEVKEWIDKQKCAPSQR